MATTGQARRGPLNAAPRRCGRTAEELEKAMEHYQRAYDIGLLLQEKVPLRPTTFWAIVGPLMSMAATSRQQGKPDKLLES